MDPITLALMGGGMGLGALKTALFDQPAHNREIQLAADTQRLSPWTQLKREAPTAEPSLFGNIMQGGMAGLDQGSKLGGAAKKVVDPVTEVSMGAAPNASGGIFWKDLIKANADAGKKWWEE